MRLIDADKLKINMDKGMQGTARDYLKFYQTAVDDQPTAYDPDKVVEQLEEESRTIERLGLDYEVINLVDAIEIVRGGAV